MHNENPVKAMREELVAAGFQELKTPQEVDSELAHTTGTILVAVNSVCGCAAGGFRPAVSTALKRSAKRPAKLLTVFAGQDKEATQKAREYFVGHAPSSPSAALLKNGEVVFMLTRSDIEGYSPEQIATKLQQALEKYC